MADPIPLTERQYGGLYLSDLDGGKVIVDCSKCAVRKQFDATALLQRIDEDCTIPELLRKLRRALKCETALAYNTFSDPQCRMVYDISAMLAANSHLPTYIEAYNGVIAYLKRQ